MDHSLFINKRNNLVEKNPVLMRETWLRNIRIVLVFCFAIGSKFAAAGLVI